MKKWNLKKIFLILLPILATGLATTVDSVIVFDSQAGTTAYYSYFELIPEFSFQAAMPLAAVLSLISGVLAAVYMVGNKEGCLKGIAGTAFCSATLAVLPFLMQGDVMIVPNVGLPIFMLIDCVLAYVMLKKPEKKEEDKGKRLKAR